MPSDRSCQACGAVLDTTDRRRKYCDDRCKMRYHRGARAEPADPRAGQPGIQSTEAATLLALADAMKLGTPSGQAALVLAARIDRSHTDTGAGLASMVKRLDELVTALTAAGPAATDPVDELQRRRQARLQDAAKEGTP